MLYLKKYGYFIAWDFALITGGEMFLVTQLVIAFLFGALMGSLIGNALAKQKKVKAIFLSIATIVGLTVLIYIGYLAWS